MEATPHVGQRPVFPLFVVALTPACKLFPHLAPRISCLFEKDLQEFGIDLGPGLPRVQRIDAGRRRVDLRGQRHRHLGQFIDRPARLGEQVVAVGFALAHTRHVEVDPGNGLGEQFQLVPGRVAGKLEIAALDLLDDLGDDVRRFVLGEHPQDAGEVTKDLRDLLYGAAIRAHLDELDERPFGLGDVRPDLVQRAGDQGPNRLARALGLVDRTQVPERDLHRHQLLGQLGQTQVVGGHGALSHRVQFVAATVQAVDEVVGPGDGQDFRQIAQLGLHSQQRLDLPAIPAREQIQGVLDGLEFLAGLGHQDRDRPGVRSERKGPRSLVGLFLADAVIADQLGNAASVGLSADNRGQQVEQEVLGLGLGPSLGIRGQGFDDLVQPSDQRLRLGVLGEAAVL